MTQQQQQNNIILTEGGNLLISVPAVATAISGTGEGEKYNQALSTLSTYIARNQKNVTHDENDKRKVWLIYPLLPSNYKKKIDTHYKDVYLEARKEKLTTLAIQLIQPSDAAYFTNLGQYSPKQAQEMARACGWLRLVSQANWHNALQCGKTEAFATAAKLIKSQNLYSLNVGNGLRLYSRAKVWQIEGRDCLLNRHIGNQYSLKGGEHREVMEQRILDLYASPLKPTVTKVTEIYNDEALAHGWETLTRQRIDQILNMPSNVATWYASRHGKNEARAKMENVLKGKRLCYADEVWSWDGTTVQLYHTDGNKLTKELYRVTIADGYSGAIIAEAFGETENADVCLEAFRLAIEFGGYLPKVIQMDGAIARMKRVQAALKTLETLGIRAQPYNGKSKYIERVLGRKEQGIMRFYGNFTGGNVTGKSLEAKANPDHIKLLKKEKGLPTTRRGVIFQDLVATILYNNTVVKKYKKTPIEMYNQPDARRTKADRINVAIAFWNMPDRPITYDRNGLRLTLGENTFDYVVEDTEERGLESQTFRRKWLGAKFKVRYHPDEMEKILLFDLNDKYVTEAISKFEFTRIPTKGEQSTLRKALDQRSKFVEDGLQKRQEIRVCLEAKGHQPVSFELGNKDAFNRAQLDLGIEHTTKTLNTKTKKETATAIHDDDDDSSVYEIDTDFVNSLID
jgi:transposase InsO family protein